MIRVASCRRSTIAAFTVGAVVGASSLSAQGVVSPFDGSVELGRWSSEFATFVRPTVLQNNPTVERHEGSLLSRVFTKPGDKSNLEVFRSYQRELEAAGFTIEIAGEAGSNTELGVRGVYQNETPGFIDRAYAGPNGRVGVGELARVGTQAEYYLAARRTEGSNTLWVAVVLSRSQDLYMIEELTLAEMETGTVRLDLDQLRDAIDRSGRIAIYDIHFATGSAEIESRSAEALAVIAAFLGERDGRFYIVGHTDDTGTLESNLTLAAARAAAVRDALVDDYGIAAARLEARGVGPLSPVSTNTGEEGRALNRRVEIVERLPGG